MAGYVLDPNCSGVSGVLHRWTGDLNFEDPVDLRDVNNLEGWRPEFDPEQWQCDPGEVELVWRVIEEGVFAWIESDYNPAEATAPQEPAYGVIRRGRLYRTVRHGNSGDYLDGIGYGFDFDGYGFWNFRGDESSPGDGYGLRDWVLEFGTVRFNGACDECGVATWRGDWLRRQLGQLFPAPHETNRAIREIARFTGDVHHPDLPRDSVGKLFYFANNLSTDNGGLDPIDFECADTRPRWDSAGEGQIPRTRPDLSIFGSLPLGIRSAEDIANADLGNVSFLSLGNGLFGMHDGQALVEGYYGEVYDSYDPRSYVPTAALDRVKDWLATGGKTLVVYPYWFGQHASEVELPVADGASVCRPGRSASVAMPSFSLYPPRLGYGAFPWLDAATTGVSETSPGVVEYPGRPMNGVIHGSLLDATNRVWSHLGLTSRVSNDHGYRTTTNDDGDTDSLNANCGVTHYGSQRLADWPDELETVRFIPQGYILPFAAGGPIIADAQIVIGSYADPTLGYVWPDDGDPATQGHRTVDRFPLGCVEEITGSRVVVFCVHQVPKVAA